MDTKRSKTGSFCENPILGEVTTPISTIGFQKSEIPAQNTQFEPLRWSEMVVYPRKIPWVAREPISELFLQVLFHSRPGRSGGMTRSAF